MNRPAQTTRRALIFSWLALVLALSGYVLFGGSILYLRIVPTAPPACAQEAPQPSSAEPAEDLFVGITSAIGRSGFRGVQIPTDANTAICLVRARDGAILKHFTLGKNINVAALLQGDGLLYYLLEGANEESQLCALQTSSGQRRWCHTLAISRGALYQGPLLVQDQHILYMLAPGGESSHIYAFRTSDGVPLWDKSASAPGVAIAPGSVYVLTSEAQVCRLQASDGATRWCAPAAVSPITGLAADSTGVYVVDRQGTVTAYQPVDGSLLWHLALGRESTNDPFIFSSPLLLQGGILYVPTFTSLGTSQGILTAIQVSNGHALWETPPNSLDAVVARQGVVYLGGQDRLEALRATSGQLIWQRPFLRGPVYSLTLGGSVLYRLDNGGNLAAFRTSDGTPLWAHTPCVQSGPQTSSIPGAPVVCTWGTERPDNGPGWWAQTTVNTSAGFPGAIAPLAP